VFGKALEKTFRVIAPDLRGYGSSKTSSPFEMTDHLLDLECLLETLHLDPCLLLGWSLGGILALELALRFPQRIQGLILIASAARPVGNHPPITWWDQLSTGIASLINAVVPGWEWNIETFGKQSLYRYLIQQHTPRTYRYLAQEALPAFFQTSSQATTALQRALRAKYSCLDRLTTLSCPVLVMAGAEDRHIMAQASQETAQVLLPNATWVCYPQTAHLFPWEIPDQVCADLEHWLDQQGFG
jgi:proline iminopeptidase